LEFLVPLLVRRGPESGGSTTSFDEAPELPVLLVPSFAFSTLKRHVLFDRRRFKGASGPWEGPRRSCLVANPLFFLPRYTLFLAVVLLPTAFPSALTSPCSPPAVPRVSFWVQVTLLWWWFSATHSVRFFLGTFLSPLLSSAFRG